MGKPTKRQARKPYHYDMDRRKAWKKKKKLPAIRCKEIKESWDRRKTVFQNLKEMGLSTDPNKTLKIKKTKELLSPMDLEESSSSQEFKSAPKKLHVAKALEEEASIPAAKTNKLSDPEVLYCTYMLDKYGDDYKAMARDAKNHYQETPKQIKKKINMFKNNTEQYQMYLQSKVDEIWNQRWLNCCSPEPTELRGIPPPYNPSVRRLRRVTRKYEAARRNGHYSISPAVIDDGTTIKLPVCLSRVRRKLNFGRKPPRNRSNHENENPDENRDSRTEQNKEPESLSNVTCKCFAGEMTHLSNSDCTRKSTVLSSSSYKVQRKSSSFLRS